MMSAHKVWPWSGDSWWSDLRRLDWHICEESGRGAQEDSSGGEMFVCNTIDMELNFLHRFYVCSYGASVVMPVSKFCMAGRLFTSPTTWYRQ